MIHNMVLESCPKLSHMVLESCPKLSDVRERSQGIFESSINH